MQPGFDLRIRTMNKALTEVILPAIDKTNKAAAEQLQLVVGSLNLIAEQIDYAHWYEVVDGRALIAMAEQLERDCGAPLGANVSAAIAAVRTATGRYDITLSDLRGANIRLRETLSEAIDDAMSKGDASRNRLIAQTIIRMSKDQTDRERAFVAKTNFDVFPDTLKSIPDALKAAVA